METRTMGLVLHTLCYAIFKKASHEKDIGVWDTILQFYVIWESAWS